MNTTTNTNTKKKTPFPLRLDPCLLEWLRSRSEENFRSINSEINQLISNAKLSEKDLRNELLLER